MVEEYLLSKRNDIQNQLTYRWYNSVGKDLSDLLRGKLEMIDNLLHMKDFFDELDKVENNLKKEPK